MVPLGLFRSRPVAVSVAGGAAFSIGFYGLVFLLSLYFQQLRGLTAAETGLAFLPTTGITGVLTLVAPRIAARFGPRVPMAAGQLLQAAGLLGLCLTVAWAPVWAVAAVTVLIGLGASLAVPTLTALLVASVPGERAGAASGVLNTCRQVGGALAVAVFGALVANPATFLTGLQVSLVIAALVLLATAAASLSLRSQRGATSP
jgi:DHA2 family methylenomycin A resistance protein-like MFS transporter